MRLLIKNMKDEEPLALEIMQDASVGEVKALIQEKQGFSPEAQKLIFKKRPMQEDAQPLKECGVADGAMLILLVTEVEEDFNADFTTWDVESSKNPEMLTGTGNILTCPKLTKDFLCVVTKAPLTSGRHYVQFTMHHIEDEEWCGVTPLPEQTKSNPYPTGLQGWLYYCGRMRCTSGHGGLQFMDQKSRQKATMTKSEGDVIGMAIDLGTRRIVFDLNGVYQGGASISDGPMWIITTVDRPTDKIEVRKLSVSDMPGESKLRLESGIFSDPPQPAVDHPPAPAPALTLERATT